MAQAAQKSSARTNARTPNAEQSKRSKGVDLGKMNRDQLLQLQKDVQTALRSYEKRKRDEALRQMQLVAEKHGISLKDVLKGGAKTSVQPPKYRHPENPESTWSGRGRQPGWFKHAMESGVSRDDLLIA